MARARVSGGRDHELSEYPAYLFLCAPRRLGERSSLPSLTIAMTQAWHTLVDTIRQLPSAPGSTSVQAEKATLELALDQLSALIDLRKGIVSPTPEATPPPGMQGKRKRRPSHSSPGLGMFGSESGLSSVASPHARAGTPSQMAAKRRAGTLPGTPLSQKTPPGGSDDLRPGIKVAAKQKAHDGEWVLATIKNRQGTKYEVQDADDGSRWTVSIAQIIKLPNGEEGKTFKKGDTVHALYPDTTSFYKATVIQGLEGRTYKLSFVDDGDNISEVDRDFVVLVSLSEGIRY